MKSTIDEWVTLGEAARRVGMSYAGMYNAVKRGRLMAIMIPGRLWVTTMDEVERAFAEGRLGRPGRPRKSRE